MEEIIYEPSSQRNYTIGEIVDRVVDEAQKKLDQPLLRAIALESSVRVLSGRDVSATEVLVTADRFLAWLEEDL
jgi:hypothetical protein